MDQRKYRSTTLTCALVLLAASSSAYGQTTKPDANMPVAASSRVPTCDAVASAVKNSYGPISSVKDMTTMVQKFAQSPYPLYRYCEVFVPGSQLPINIIFNQISAQKIDAMENMMKSGGAQIQKMTDMGWNYPVYMTSRPGQSAGTLVSIDGAIALHVVTHASADKTKSITQAILKLL